MSIEAEIAALCPPLPPPPAVPGSETDCHGRAPHLPARNACPVDAKADGPCCYKGLQLGPEDCIASAECRWNAGFCEQDTVCGGCRDCLEGLHQGLADAKAAHESSPQEPFDPFLQEQMHLACLSLGSGAQCEGLSWAGWYSGTVRSRCSQLKGGKGGGEGDQHSVSCSLDGYLSMLTASQMQMQMQPPFVFLACQTDYGLLLPVRRTAWDSGLVASWPACVPGIAWGGRFARGDPPTPKRSLASM